MVDLNWLILYLLGPSGFNLFRPLFHKAEKFPSDNK
jgi:hypothetical protein